jgi:energy-coupling factor transport system permease protein
VKNLEFFRNVSIGQYQDTGSRVHALTPATKYLLLLALAMPAIAARGPAGVLLPAAGAIALGAAAGVSPLFLLRGLKPALPLLAITAFLQLMFAWPGDDSAVVLAVGPFSATAREANLALMAVLRTAALMLAVGLFTSIAAEGEIAHGIEDALAPFSRLGLGTHRLAFVVSIAFRFIPIVAGELESIVKAQSSRGADFGSGRGGPLAKARAYLPLFVPVTVRALERAELLAEAMEARCWTGDGRSRYVVYERVKGEWLVRSAAALFFAAAVAVDIIA